MLRICERQPSVLGVLLKHKHVLMSF